MNNTNGSAPASPNSNSPVPSAASTAPGGIPAPSAHPSAAGEQRPGYPLLVVGLILADLSLGYCCAAYFRYGGGLSFGGKDLPQIVYYVMLVLVVLSLLSVFLILKRKTLLSLIGTAMVLIPLALTAHAVPSVNSSFNSTQSKTVLGGSPLFRTERDQWKSVGLSNLLLSKEEDTRCSQNFVGCNARIFAYYGSNDSIEQTIQEIDNKFKKAGWNGHGLTSDELAKALAWNQQHSNLKPFDDVVMNYGISTNGKSVGVIITFFNGDPKSFENEEIRKNVSDKYSSQYKLFYELLVSGGPQ
jgi:hypothetical protein